MIVLPGVSGCSTIGAPGSAISSPAPSRTLPSVLNRVQDEKRKADVSEPGGVGVDAVHERKCHDGVGVAFTRHHERQRALVRVDQALGAGGKLDDLRLGDEDQ